MDIYGKVLNIVGASSFIPFRYQGQYEDVETELYYNRFRYYSPDSGCYISQDPIGLAGGMPNMYSYVHDLNTFIDPFGLVSIGTKGFSVYGLFKEGSSILYYVGITTSTEVRKVQHKNGGRRREGDQLILIDQNTDMTIEEARGK